MPGISKGLVEPDSQLTSALNRNKLTVQNSDTTN